MGNEIEATPIYPGKLYPQQNKSSYTAGKKARMMRLICKTKENDRRGISNHDIPKEEGKKWQKMRVKIVISEYHPLQFTHGTCFGNTVGIPIPILNPNWDCVAVQCWCRAWKAPQSGL